MVGLWGLVRHLSENEHPLVGCKRDRMGSPVRAGYW